MRLTIALAALPAFALAACGAPADETAPGADTQPDAMKSPIPVEPDGGIGDGAGPPAAGGQAATTIPAALQGRWGLVPADCTSTRGDAKGLITVDGSSIKFYESRATLGEVAQSSDTSIRAQFAFTGEGMEWNRDTMLAAQGDDKLVRTEYGEEAMADPLTYTKCA
ncbi:hypothetical protein [Pelagerythrobacter sp.]|uniref:hypothetical protein n=1 Tax=Pelagerythrobacter sp. TaxID=2800702 RepID=UPI0035B087BB